METYKKAIVFILIFLIPSFIVLAYFYLPSLKLPLLKKEVPKVRVRNDIAIDWSKVSAYIKNGNILEMKYKNSTFYIYIFETKDENETEGLKEDLIKKINPIDKKNTTVDGFEGYELYTPAGDGAIFWKNNVIFTLGVGEINTVMEVAEWLVKNYEQFL